MSEYFDEGQAVLLEKVEKASMPEHIKERTSARYIESVTDKPFGIVLSVTEDWKYGCASLGFNL